ncbi:MAG: hypothetical protein QOH21_1449, partial [Acidobacteriota bacterium]|nr:hypothetical protein [Acidobacteriota bacterium]
IYHNGGSVSFVAPYETLEAANVEGTREVLRLAAATRVKPVHVVSTLSVHFTPARIGSTVHETDALPAGSEIEGGYVQTKWVADRVAQLARTAGLPVSIHRPARITGDSRTGAHTTDFFYAWLRGCIELGAFPRESGVLNMTPVDHIARAIVRLSLDGSTAEHHYFHNGAVTVDTLADLLRRRGLAAAILPFADWREALRRDAGNALAKFSAFVDAPAGDEPLFDCSTTDSLLAAHGLACPAADERLLSLYLDRLGVSNVTATTGDLT